MERYKFFPARYLWRAGTGLCTNMSVKEDNNSSVPQLVCTGLKRFPLSVMDKRADFCGLNTQIMGVNVDEYPVVKVAFDVKNIIVPDKINVHWYCDRFEFDISCLPQKADDGYELEFNLSNYAQGNSFFDTEDNLEKFEIFFLGDNKEQIPEDAVLTVKYIAMLAEDCNIDSNTLINENHDFMLNYDDGVRYDWEKLEKSTAEEYLMQSKKRKEEIINSPNIDISNVKGTVYYVSSLNGNDDNDGLSPQTAWKSLEKLNEIDTENKCSKFLKYGDVVLFERGSKFYCTTPSRNAGMFGLLVFSGVTYSAYGEGEKPVFTNEINMDGAGKWLSTQWDNVWVLDYKFVHPDYTDSSYCDVGNITFDGGRLWGIRVTPQFNSDPYRQGVKSVNAGLVTNGRDIYYSGNKEFTSPGCLENNLEFFHDWAGGKLYLCCKDGNPGEVFNDIRIAQKGYVIYSHWSCGEGSDITVSNLSVKYCSSYGVDIGTKNITIENCEISWIGGGIHGSESIRYGQGFEWYGGMDGFTMKNCWVHQTYDAAVTVQTEFGVDKPIVMNNLNFTDNVFEYNGSIIEIWCGVDKNKTGRLGKSPDIISNVLVQGNYMLYPGYGYNHQRSSKRTSVFCGCYCEFENYIVRDNIMMFGQRNVWDESPVWTTEHQRGMRSIHNFYAFSSVYNNMYYIYENFNRHTFTFMKGKRIELPYDERIIRYAVKTGAETDSVFRWYDEPLFDIEEQGVFH